jgi:hypothetical protein
MESQKKVEEKIDQKKQMEGIEDEDDDYQLTDYSSN